MADSPLTEEPQSLILQIKDKVDFDVDHDNELCIEIEKEYATARAWLTRAEGQQLLDLLTRWLK